MRVFVPVKLERENPMVATAIRLACKTQLAADKQIRKHMPEWVGTYVETRKVETRKPQTQSEYTLSGGTCDFQPTPRRKRESLPPGVMLSLKAITDTQECRSFKAKPVRPKCYLDAPHPEYPTKYVPQLSDDEHWLKRPIR